MPLCRPLRARPPCLHPRRISAITVGSRDPQSIDATGRQEPIFGEAITRTPVVFEWRRAVFACTAAVSVAALSWWMLTSGAVMRQIDRSLDEGEDAAAPVMATVESVDEIAGLSVMTVSWLFENDDKVYRTRLPADGDEPGGSIELVVLSSGFSTVGGVAYPARFERGLPATTRDAVELRSTSLWIGGFIGVFLASGLLVVGLHHLVPSRPG